VCIYRIAVGSSRAVLQLVAQRSADVEVGDEDMRRAFDKVLPMRCRRSCDDHRSTPFD
jgi:hypothetical protein